MATQLIDSHRENAEIYTGNDLCLEKTLELLAEIDLPNGLLPLKDVSEVGYNRNSGFVWLKQKKSLTHLFKNVDRNVSYDKEITAFVEKHRMKKITGVKSKELLIWVAIGEIHLEENDPDKIVFKNPATGINRVFPVSAFHVEENVRKSEEKK